MTRISPAEATLGTDGEPVQLLIGGMTCASCAARVERKLNRMDGVSASVNYATEKATVHADGVAVEELIRTVERTGYSAEVVTPQVSAAPQDTDDRRVRMLGRRMIVAVVLAFVLMDLSMGMAFVPEWHFAGWQWVLIG